MTVPDCLTVHDAPLVWPEGASGRIEPYHPWTRTRPEGGVVECNLWLYRGSYRLNAALEAPGHELENPADDSPCVTDALQDWIERHGHDVRDGAVLRLTSTRDARTCRVSRWDFAIVGYRGA